MPVTSRSLKRTLPASGWRWPVMRLKRVVLPAPLGPMMALIDPRGTVKLTPLTAWKPSKLLRSPVTSSTRRPSPHPLPEGHERPRDAPGEDEEEHHEDGAENERPVLGVGDDLLVEPDQHDRAEGGAEERAHAAQEGHDQDLGGFGPVGEVGEDTAVEDAEEATRQPREAAREHEGRQLVAAHVDPDELGALRVLPDGGEHAAERRADDAAEQHKAGGHEDEGHEVEVLGGAVAAEEGQKRRHAVDPAEVGVGDLRHALLAPRDLVPLEAYRPDDLGEGEGQHGEVDPRQPHAKKAEDEGEQPGDDSRGGEGEEKRYTDLLHEDARGVGADAEVRRVPEGDEAGVADEEVEAGGEERPDDEVVGEKGVVARSRGRHEQRGHDHHQRPRNFPGHFDIAAEAPAQSLRRPAFGQILRVAIAMAAEAPAQSLRRPAFGRMLVAVISGGGRGGP